MPDSVEGLDDASRKLGRTSAVDEVEQGMQVEGRVRGDRRGCALVEPRGDKPLSAPGNDRLVFTGGRGCACV